MDNWNAIVESTGVSEVVAQQAKDYLDHFGYLAGNVLAGPVDEKQAVARFGEALIKLQSTAGVPASGQLDSATLGVMLRRRCGCLDVAREVLEAKWRKGTLTYQVQDYVNRLSHSDQDNIIEAAWASWRAVADRNITRIGVGTPDIVISVGQGRGMNFDGPSGTLAWAYLPGGDDGQLLMRFDIDETWIADPAAQGILMLNVASHEFGHLLGLDHSRVSSALMAPFYNPKINKPQQNDDIPRIQALYGPATGTPPPPSPPSPPTSPPTTPGVQRVTIEFTGRITKIIGPVAADVLP